MSVRVRFVVDDVALEQVFLRVLRSSYVSVIPPMLRTTFHIHFAVSRSVKPGNRPKITLILKCEGIA